MKNVSKCQKNNYKTRNLLAYLHHQKHELICLDFSRQKNTNIRQQILFAGKLEKDNGVTMFLLPQSSKKLL